MIVAIIGRPNVGKSTLFNRLIGEQKAVTFELPGTTRDRLYGKCEWQGKEFLLVDTAGVELEINGKIAMLADDMERQIQVAIQDADVIVFLQDGTKGVSGSDKLLAQRLRKTGKKIILAVNKIDRSGVRQGIAEYYSMGLGEPIEVSAERGMGTGDLLDILVKQIKGRPKKEAKSSVPKVAIIGRPNAGKSSLTNALLQENRVIVSELPGTTVDAVDVEVTFDDKKYMLIDTAGVKRRGNRLGLEKFSTLRALRAMERADVVLLVIDGREGPVVQDAHIAGYAIQERKGLVIVVSKWDLVEESNQARDYIIGKIAHEIKFVPWAPLVFTSSVKGLNLNELFKVIGEVATSRKKLFSTEILEGLLDEIKAQSKIPGAQPTKLVQVAVSPPTFSLAFKGAKNLNVTQLRYLDRLFHQYLKIVGTPIRILLNGK